jgi:hypothetical protein
LRQRPHPHEFTMYYDAWSSRSSNTLFLDKYPKHIYSMIPIMGIIFYEQGYNKFKEDKFLSLNLL